MAEFKIVHDRPTCIGCATCAAINPEHWKMSEVDGKANVIGADKVGTDEILEIKDLEGDMNAAEACPVNCIHSYNGEEKLI